MVKSLFWENIKKHVEPILYDHRFEGTKGCYRKCVNEIINFIWIQEHSDKSKFCVNLGVHLSFLPAVPGSKIIPFNEMDQAHCEIKKRLVPSHDLVDYWWLFSELNDSMLEVLDAYQTDGVQFFNRFSNYPSDWQNFTVGNVKDPSFTTLLPGVTKVRAALMFARIHKQLGDLSKCKEFANLGLEVAGKMAVGPRSALKALLKECE